MPLKASIWRCGHTQSEVNPGGETFDWWNFKPKGASCSQPDKCIFVKNSDCSGCKSRKLPPLPREERQRRKSKYLLLEAQAKKYFLEMDQHNKPLEEELCGIAPDLLTIVQARQLHTIWFQLYHYILTMDDLVCGSRIKRLEKAILDMPLTLLEEMSLDERFFQVEILGERFAWDCEIYARRDNLIEEVQHYFEGVEAMNKKLVSLMAQIKPQIERLSEIVQRDCLEDTCSENSESKNGESTVESSSSINSPLEDKLYCSRREELLFAQVNDILPLASSLEAAVPLEDSVLLGTSLEERLRAIAEDYAYYQIWFRQELEDKYRCDDADDDAFFKGWIEAGMPEYDLHAREKIFGALKSVSVDDIPENERQCSICREAYEKSDTNPGEEPVKFQCGHTFGKECVMRWVIGMSVTECPLCRQEFLPAFARRRRNGI